MTPTQREILLLLQQGFTLRRYTPGVCFISKAGQPHREKRVRLPTLQALLKNDWVTACAITPDQREFEITVTGAHALREK